MATSSTGAEPPREIKHTFRRSVLFSSGRRTHNPFRCQSGGHKDKGCFSRQPGLLLRALQLAARIFFGDKLCGEEVVGLAEMVKVKRLFSSLLLSITASHCCHLYTTACLLTSVTPWVRIAYWSTRNNHVACEGTGGSVLWFYQQNSQGWCPHVMDVLQTLCDHDSPRPLC